MGGVLRRDKICDMRVCFDYMGYGCSGSLSGRLALISIVDWRGACIRCELLRLG